jgi:adenylate cyclase
MSVRGLTQNQGPGRVQLVVRSLRLSTALILFSYAVSHLVDHAFGIRSIRAMEAASAVLLAPWKTYPGLFALYGAFLIHGLLGLLALYRRRTLRMPGAEAWQLVLGLSIPVLLIPHAGAVRLGQSLYGLEFDYSRVLYQLWVHSPDIALPRQLLLVLVLWLHGCIGLRAWLRSKPWYARAAPALASVATLVPVLSIIGVVNAGLGLRDAIQSGTIDAGRLATALGNQSLPAAVDRIWIAYLALVAGVIVTRAGRDWHARRFHAIHVTYLEGRTVTAPLGLSILEISRWAGIPHESVCGGRGRCSTCRVRIAEGAEGLEKPAVLELRTLRRIRASSDVRLACQVRPTSDLTVEPLVHPRSVDASESIRFDAAVAGGRELEIAAMFVDLRGSTELATDRLPYDALFIFDRYIQAVSGAIRAHGGRVTSVAGDGIMSVFGKAAAARHALHAARDVWSNLDVLNTELAGELSAPLRIGIGLHVGTAVVGWVSMGASQSLQFLGDTGNVAAKLEDRSKDLGCTLVISVAALDAAACPADAFERASVGIAGRRDPVEVAVVRRRDDLDRVVARLPAG